jgi:hypothetical protein
MEEDGGGGLFQLLFPYHLLLGCKHDTHFPRKLLTRWMVHQPKMSEYNLDKYQRLRSQARPNCKNGLRKDISSSLGLIGLLLFHSRLGCSQIAHWRCILGSKELEVSACKTNTGFQPSKFFITYLFFLIHKHNLISL